MKKIIFGLTIILFIVLLRGANTAQALTPTPTDDLTPTVKPKPTSVSTTPQDSQIEKIKDLVASRVAELKLVDKRGLLGYVKSTSTTGITITDNTQQEVKIDIDELTKFTGPDSKTSFGISDIKNGDLLSLIGLYNKQTEKLLARFVEEANYIPQNLEGVVLSKDDANYTFDIALADGSKKTINVETSTKTVILQDGDTTKAGFSKIGNGDRVIVVGFSDKTVKDQINASRIIDMPGMPLSSELKSSAAKNVSKGASESPTKKP